MEIVLLKHPITVGGAEVKQLTLRRPRVRDLLAAEKAPGGDVMKEIRLLANLAEVEPAVVEELDLADYTRVQEVYRGFLSM